MRTVWAVVVGFAMVATACATATSSPGSAAGATSPADRAVAVRALGCHGDVARVGGGTSIGGDRVLTVAHTVAGATDVTVVDARGAERRARVVALDTRRDLAVLAVEGLAAPEVEMGELAPGDEGRAVVPGRERPVDFVVERAVDITFSDIYERGEHVRPGYELLAEVVEGDSGAGLFDDDGRLAAVVFARSSHRGDRAWATDVAAADAVLRSTGLPSSAPCIPS